MKNILLFGAGKSASVLIEYLLNNAFTQHWHVTIVDTDKKMIEQKTNHHSSATAIEADITADELRRNLIKSADIVISMMPPFLHILIAKDCIEYSKNLLTASYADEQIKMLEKQVNEKSILFICEMGLDPGIDHMSAMQLIDTIQEKGGKITSFKSHCGGLIAPESDNNPWHYKITWNPRNVVLAGKTGAIYKENNEIISEKYETLFNAERLIETDDIAIKTLSYYPNRDSLPYIDLYNLHDAQTFVRTTLRYAAFMQGWNTIVALQLTSENIFYETDNVTLDDFFKAHISAYQNEVKLTEEDIIRLNFLGANDSETLINKGKISVAAILQFALESKLVLNKADKDMIVMQHEIEYELNQKKYLVKSFLKVIGQDSVHTAMAKTVGLPLGIAAKLILNGEINLVGIHLPTVKEIYQPVLQELESNGIIFSEKVIPLK